MSGIRLIRTFLMVLRASDAENQLIALNQCAAGITDSFPDLYLKTLPIFRVRARADNASAEINASRDESFRVVS